MAMTGEQTVKPQEDRFMSHLVLPKVRGQGCWAVSDLIFLKYPR